jgi:hypothetical protein
MTTTGDLVKNQDRSAAPGEGAPNYEPPVLTPMGNLYDVVAGSTKLLVCDGIDVQPGSGDHNPTSSC